MGTTESKIYNFTKNFSRLVTLAGGIPFIILVSLPSLVFIGFNIYFTSSIATLIIKSLDLASLFGKMLRGFLYLATALLIMYPLLETWFKTTNGEISENEKYYLKIFNWVALGLITIVGGLFIACAIGFIGNGILVDVMQPKTVLTSFETFLNFFITVEIKVGERNIQFIEGMLSFLCFCIIYFTDKAAGICLITMKDVLFPDAKSQNDSKPADPSGLGGLEQQFETKANQLDGLVINTQSHLNQAKTLLDDLRKFKNKINNIDHLKGKACKKRIEELESKVTDAQQRINP